MKFTSLFTRLGLVAFGFILVAVLNRCLVGSGLYDADHHRPC